MLEFCFFENFVFEIKFSKLSDNFLIVFLYYRNKFFTLDFKFNSSFYFIVSINKDSFFLFYKIWRVCFMSANISFFNGLDMSKKSSICKEIDFF